jgi:hypothetical protein
LRRWTIMLGQLLAVLCRALRKRGTPVEYM